MPRVKDAETTVVEEEDVFECTNCENEVSEDDMSSDVTDVCESCIDKDYFDCGICDATTHDDNMNSVQGQNICDSCYESDAVQCIDCNHDIFRDDDRHVQDGHLCEDCHDERQVECCECGEQVDRQTSANFDSYENEWYCTRCKGKDIYNYTYKPTPHFHHTEDPKKETVFAGFELEVENVKAKYPSNEVAAKIHKDHGGLLYCKSDSSISSGFEIVSHPCSFDWYRKNVKTIKKILSIKKKGFRSYQTTTCGMHVHISNQDFTTLHLLKFLNFIYAPSNAKFVVRISQRKSNELDQWASLKGDGSNNLSEKAKAKSSLGSGRNTAVNLSTGKTVEVRLFRGTLNYGSFMKNIEFVFGLYAFSKVTAKADASSQDKFMEYIEENKSTYPNLHNFIEEMES